jgi:hypothetical protein
MARPATVRLSVALGLGLSLLLMQTQSVQPARQIALNIPRRAACSGRYSGGRGGSFRNIVRARRQLRR